MACIIICHCTTSITGKVTRRGSEPRGPVTWSASAWFVMPNGEKHTHSAIIPGQTVQSLAPAMGALIDSLIADHGNEVQSAGWTATAHGKKKKRK
jgi:hypothetical protein